MIHIHVQFLYRTFDCTLTSHPSLIISISEFHNRFEKLVSLFQFFDSPQQRLSLFHHLCRLDVRGLLRRRGRFDLGCWSRGGRGLVAEPVEEVQRWGRYGRGRATADVLQGCGFDRRCFDGSARSRCVSGECELHVQRSHRSRALDGGGLVSLLSPRHPCTRRCP